MRHLIDNTLRKSPFIALWGVTSWGTARAELGRKLRRLWQCPGEGMLAWTKILDVEKSVKLLNSRCI